MKKHLYSYLLALGLYLTTPYSLADDSSESNQALKPTYITLELNNTKFKVDTKYLFADRTRVGGRNFKKHAKVDYFSIDVLFPSMKPVRLTGKSRLARKNQITIYVSSTPPLSLEKLLKNWNSKQLIVEKGFDRNTIERFDQRWIQGEESRGDKDIYVDKSTGTYIICDKENWPGEPPRPRCSLTSNYKGMDVSASFSRKYKYDFININNSIHQLLASFEIQKYKLYEKLDFSLTENYR